jgi:transcriptional regulator with XRE-family HTH domain
MRPPTNANQYRLRIRDAIQRKFAELVTGVKSGQGSLAEVAEQLGVRRQAMDQYASGSVPASDVLLMALLKWNWQIRVEDPKGQPSWCEFSVSDMEGGIKRRKPEPVQLSLFDALTDLDQNMDTLKKSVGRVEFEIKRAFGKLG